MIPDEAVEAAAKQMAVNDGDLISWVLYQADAQRVLESAAPYLMAQAWDEGASWMNDSGAYTRDDNPYRSA